MELRKTALPTTKGVSTREMRLKWAYFVLLCMVHAFFLFVVHIMYLPFSPLSYSPLKPWRIKDRRSSVLATSIPEPRGQC